MISPIRRESAKKSKPQLSTIRQSMSNKVDRAIEARGGLPKQVRGRINPGVKPAKR